MLEFKTAQDNMAKTLGYDCNTESFIKGQRNIVVMCDIVGDGEIKGENFKLVHIFEMAPIKVDLFNCDQYVITIDDLVLQLIDALKTD